jgi:hypothetical protein
MEDNRETVTEEAEGTSLADEKAERIETERKDILNKVVSGNIKNVRDRVAFILNLSGEARNSDLELAWTYWEYFEPHKFNGKSINKDQFKTLTKFNSLSRMRAKLQNEYKLFEADVDVRRFRKTLREDTKREVVEDKPEGIGLYSVYIDETGKTQDYLSVGSLWLLDAGLSLVLGHLELDKWRKDRNINFEFHFTELNRSRVPTFKEFFTKFLSLNPTVGFKVIVVRNTGFSDKNSAITDLTYHLLSKGINHEDSSGRAPLPRMLQVWVDEEEKGSDALKLENIQERLESQKIEGLFLDGFKAVSSKDNFMIQITDLCTGALNRKLHYPNGTHFKDEFADFVLESLKFDLNLIDKENNSIDHSTVFNLR